MAASRCPRSRIVTTDFPETCALLDLGILPVGRTGYVPDFPADDNALKDAPTVDETAVAELLDRKSVV